MGEDDKWFDEEVYRAAGYSESEIEQFRVEALKYDMRSANARGGPASNAPSEDMSAPAPTGGFAPSPSGYLPAPNGPIAFGQGVGQGFSDEMSSGQMWGSVAAFLTATAAMSKAGSAIKNIPALKARRLAKAQAAARSLAAGEVQTFGQAMAQGASRTAARQGFKVGEIARKGASGLASGASLDLLALLASPVLGAREAGMNANPLTSRDKRYY